MSDSTQNIINKLRGSGARKRKRAASVTARNAKRKKNTKRTLPRKRRGTIKEDIFHNLHHSRYDHVSDRLSFRE